MAQPIEPVALQTWMKRALIYINQCVAEGEISFPGIEEDTAGLAMDGFELFGLAADPDVEKLKTANLVLHEDQIDAAARAYEEEGDHQRGEPSLWELVERGDIADNDAHFKQYREDCMDKFRLALAALG